MNFKDKVAHDEPVECGNCNWQGAAEKTNDINDFKGRMTPGGEVPVGECPICGALAYLIDDD